ncbi:hypothetical protein LINPERHAP1_LOCUS5938 [Linum perenne]
MGQLDYGQQLETGLLRQPNDIVGGGGMTPTDAVTALVAVFGSMATGCAYSTFGSIMTIGGMLGSLVNGKIGDLIGRRYAKLGRDKELEETLKYLREKGCDVSQEALDIKVVSGLMVLQEFGGTNAIAY